MGLIQWIKEQNRVKSAGNLGRNKEEKRIIDGDKFYTPEEKKRLLKLASDIGKDEERIKIASEKAKKPQQSTNIKNTNKHTEITMPVNVQGTQSVTQGDHKPNQTIKTEKVKQPKSKPQCPKKK